ncbi:MAG: M23 family metallopeptidase [Alphaproteobacteria bacterium GM202ARS2]|nr:M23 family metallopeptidase [Alphaproteobacteria bacterium GM202ARS2]
MSLQRTLLKQRSLIFLTVLFSAYYAIFEKREMTLPLPEVAFDSRVINVSFSDLYDTNRTPAPNAPDTDVTFQPIKRSESRERIVPVRHGDNLYGILQKNAIDRPTAQAIIEGLRPIYNPNRIRVGHTLAVTYALSESGEPLYPYLVELGTDGTQRFGVVRLNNGNYHAYQRAAQTTRERYRAEGTIQHSFARSLRRQKVPASVIEEAVTAFSYDIDFQRDIEKGDYVQIGYDIIRDQDTNTIISTELVAAKLITSKKTLDIYRFDKDSHTRNTPEGFIPFYHARGDSVARALLRTPLSTAYISSRFGIRQDPFSGYTRLHRGVDFAAPISTPIFAAGSGVIEEAGNRQYYGNYVKIKHNSVYRTVYAHMNAVAITAIKGARVQQGEIIGYVGSTGRSTGPHLHYEVHRHNGKINPLLVNLPPTHRLQGNQLRQFQKAVTAYNIEYSDLPTITQPQLARGSEDDNNK